MEISFSVRGVAAPQGSKTAFRVKNSTKINQTESSKRVGPWRDRVHFAAENAVERWAREHDSADNIETAAEIERMYHGPVTVSLGLVFERPASHYGTGRNADVLKASAPRYPMTKHHTAGGDIDKLVRAVLDAMTKVVYADDAQVVALLSVWKLYGPQAGLWVQVREASPIHLLPSPERHLFDLLAGEGS